MQKISTMQTSEENIDKALTSHAYNEVQSN